MASTWRKLSHAGAWIGVMLLSSFAPPLPAIESSDSCLCEGCRKLSESEFWNSTYSLRSLNVTSRPRNIKLIPNAIGRLNVTWQAPSNSTNYLLGFRLEVYRMDKTQKNQLSQKIEPEIKYNLITNSTVQNEWFVACINVGADSLMKYQFWIKLQPLPIPRSTLDTNYERAYFIMPYGDVNSTVVRGLQWWPGFTLTSSQTHPGNSTINVNIPEQGRGLIYSHISLTFCRCNSSQQKCPFIGRCDGSPNTNITCTRSNDLLICERGRYIKDGCYGVITKFTQEGCPIDSEDDRSCKRINCVGSCGNPKMKIFAVGKDVCCPPDCLAKDTTNTMEPPNDTGTPLVTTTPSMISTVEPRKGIQASVLSVIVIVIVILAASVIIIVCSRIGKRPYVKPRVLIVYSDDHTAHIDVLEKLVLFLKMQCQLHVTFYRLSSDATKINKVEWCSEKIRSSHFILFVSSEYAWLQCRASDFNIEFEHDNQVTPEGGIAVEAFHHLKRKNPAQMIINVHFQYTDREFVERIQESQVVYRLMDQLNELCLELHHLKTHNGAEKKGIKIFDGNTYHHTPEGKALQEAIAKAEKYVKAEPDWLEKKCSLNLSSLKLLTDRFHRSLPKLEPPLSVRSDGSSYALIRQWIRSIENTSLVAPSDVSEISSGPRALLQRSPTFQENVHENPVIDDEHIDSISECVYDSGLGSLGNQYDTKDSVSSEHYQADSGHIDNDMTNGAMSFHLHSPESLSENLSISDFGGVFADAEYHSQPFNSLPGYEGEYDQGSDSVPKQFNNNQKSDSSVLPDYEGYNPVELVTYTANGVLTFPNLHSTDALSDNFCACEIDGVMTNAGYDNETFISIPGCEGENYKGCWPTDSNI